MVNKKDRRLLTGKEPTILTAHARPAWQAQVMTPWV